MAASLLPWRFARRAFRPASADSAAPFQRLSDARALAGMVTIALLSIPFTSAYGAWSERQTNALLGFVATAVVAACVVVLHAVTSSPDPAARAAAKTVLLRTVLPILIPSVAFLIGKYLTMTGALH